MSIKNFLYTPAVVVKYLGPTNCRGSRVQLSIPCHDSAERRPVTFAFDYGQSGLCTMARTWLQAAGFDVVGYSSISDGAYIILVNWSGLDVDRLWSNLKKESKK